MADFRENTQSLRASQAFTELGVNMEMVKHFAELKPSMLEYFNTPNFSLATPLAHQQAEFLAGCSYNNSFSNFQTDSRIVVPRDTVRGNEVVLYESSRREVTEQSTSISKTMCSSASTSETQGDTYKNKKIRSRRGKKVGSNEKEEGNPERIIHVRAKRGQATDSHSIAERVRREKINKKMRCLQDLVPGCHKDMGMAGMLEEIINYVHSLQNQVEFLSMELAAACSSNDLNIETESSRKTQGTNSHEALEMEIWAKEAYGEYTSFHSTWSL
ncbi:hypothetical protein AB3S75_031926 [Citrus x aurantiifolia]